MARKTKKTPTTIQPTVEQFAASRTRASNLRIALQKAMDSQDAAQSALLAHTRAAHPETYAPVAYQAKSGETLLVNGRFGNIQVVEQGAQRLPEQPKADYAELEARVAEHLKAGALGEAAKLLGMEADAQNTATSQAQVTDKNQHILDDIVCRNWKMANLGELYGTGNPFKVQLIAPRFFRPTTEATPAIPQETYKSAALGPIKLSREGRNLLTYNREAIQKAIARGDYNYPGQQVSESRGRIASYLSSLEERVNTLTRQLQDLGVEA